MHRHRMLVVSLLSFAVVALEIVWTRILSAEFFYTFAFLVLSLAVLGLALGALAVRLWPRLRAGRDPGRALLLAAVAAVAAPPAVLRLGLEFASLYRSPAMAGRLVVALLLLGAPFFLAGVALARIFRAHAEEMPRLYMADLVGAGAGVGGAVVAMNLTGVPIATMLVPVVLAVASVLAGGRLRVTHAAFGVLAGVSLVWAWPLLTVPRREPGRVMLQRWDASARLKVHDMAPDYRNLNIDNAANSPVLGFDGNLSGGAAEELRKDRMLRIAELLGGRQGFVLASLGAGGGSEVLQALVEGAGEIHAIEVNPAINRMMATGELASFSGRIYTDPRVRVVSEDGRAYLRRFRGHFDVIVSSSSNSFAALASGAFALSENYLFTTEAFTDYLRALAPGGFLIMEHQFYIPRAVSEALDALRAGGAAHPEEHLAVYELPKRRRMVLLLSNRPLPASATATLMGPLPAGADAEVRLVYPSQQEPPHLVARIAVNGWRAEAATAPTDISPCTDDRPFVAQLGRWRNLAGANFAKLAPYEFTGFPVATLILLTVLGVTAVLVMPLLLVPRLWGRSRIGTVPALYFFAIGVAFMAVEVVLIQQFTLLVGTSSTTLVVILLTLLVASGLGSRLSDRVAPALPFLAIAAWLLLDILCFAALVGVVGGASLPVRVACTLVLIAPLGLAMGMPFPRAAVRVGENVDWGFAINGVASVIGSTGAVLVARLGGFRVALTAALAFYLLAGVLLACRSRWSPAVAVSGSPSSADVSG